MPVREVVDWLYEFSSEARRDGSADALRLSTAHRAKGLEFKHVIVMDCGDWGGADEERRLLYVAMTRARETLTLFRTDAKQNVLLDELETVESVIVAGPVSKPRFRPEMQRRYRALSPADVDIGFAGRRREGHRIHRDIARLSPGDAVRIRDRFVVDEEGNVVGKLANSASLPDGIYEAKVTGVMFRARQQTAPQYLASVKVDRWEVILVEAVEEMAESVAAASLDSC
jgi:ATP-dependent DNA helicase RecQ